MGFLAKSTTPAFAKTSRVSRNVEPVSKRIAVKPVLELTLDLDSRADRFQRSQSILASNGEIQVLSFLARYLGSSEPIQI